jgi:catechol 2,3-dioxygenase-like lactoylglutathione lyase family enzyme
VGEVTALEHVAIQVSDIERSVRFYREHLGFELLFRVSRNEPYVQRVVGYHPDVTLEIAELSIPGTDVRLEIIEYRDVESAPIDPATANPGTMHFSLFVDDLMEIYERLSSVGVGFVSEPQRSVAGHLKGGIVVYMKDPDDIRGELVQRPPAG